MFTNKKVKEKSLEAVDRYLGFLVSVGRSRVVFFVAPGMNLVSTCFFI